MRLYTQHFRKYRNVVDYTNVLECNKTYQILLNLLSVCDSNNWIKDFHYIKLTSFNWML